jgi:Flp pilus assembly protein TadG
MARRRRPGSGSGRSAKASSGRAARLKLWWEDRSGSEAIEFAILAPLLLVMLVGLVELGMSIRQQMEAQDSAAAGALYAAGNGWNTVAIQTAVTSAKPGSGVTATPAPVQACGCPGATTVTPAACGTTCGDGAAARSYVTVSASVARQSFLPSTLPLPATLTATATARLP